MKYPGYDSTCLRQIPLTILPVQKIAFRLSFREVPLIGGLRKSRDPWRSSALRQDLSKRNLTGLGPEQFTLELAAERLGPKGGSLEFLRLSR